MDNQSKTVGVDYSQWQTDLAKLQKLSIWDEIERLWRQHREPLARKLLDACANSTDPNVRAAFAGYMADGVIIELLRNVEQSKPKERKRKKREEPKSSYPAYESPLSDDDPLNYAL